MTRFPFLSRIPGYSCCTCHPKQSYSNCTGIYINNGVFLLIRAFDDYCRYDVIIIAFSSFFFVFFYQALPASNQDVDLLDISSSVPACSSPLLFADVLPATRVSNSVSLASPVHAGPPGPPPQVPPSPGVSRTTSASLNQILQDLDLLDLGRSTECVISSSFW